MTLGDWTTSLRSATFGSGLALLLAVSTLGAATASATGAASAEPAPRVITSAGGAEVDVDVDSLRAADEGDRFTVELPEGTREAEVTYREDLPGFTGWAGTVGDDGWFTAVVGEDGTLRLDVDSPSGATSVTTGAGGYRISRTAQPDPSHAEQVDDALVPPAQLSDGAADRARVSDRRKVKKVRVMFAYSRQARKAAGGKKQLVAMARSVIVQTNSAFRNSKMARVRVVYAGLVSAGSREKPRNLYRNLASTWKKDRRFDRLPRLRNKHHADLVHLFVKTADRTGACGLGYLRPAARYAYSVATLGCATRWRGSSHEIGHNFGADHDAGAGYRPTAKLPARGMVSVPDRWITVMAYYDKCTRAGVYCTRIPYYSTPKVRVDGTKTGHRRKAFNARVIANRSAAVSRFR